MPVKWEKTRFPGVRYYEHATRRHGVGKDRYFSIRYQRDGKRAEEGLGWSSEGWTAERAALELAELKKAHLTGGGPVRLSEKRDLEKARREQEVKAKEQAELENLTFGEFFEETYLPHSKQNKKRESWRKEDEHFRTWIKPTIGALPLRKIVPLSLERIKKNMADAGKAPRSIQYVFATIRQVWNMAKRDGLVDTDSPTKQVKTPRFDNQRQRYLTQDECDRLMAELKNRSQQLHNIALLSLDCGLRAGEIFSLDWQDVDLDRETLTLRDTESTKTRTAYMTAEVKAMFGAMPDLRAGLVFKKRKGGRESKGGFRIEKVSNAFDRAADAIGLNDGIEDRRYRAVFHTMRHTYASRLIEHGKADLYTVKELLGHSTLSVTERYSHLTESHLRDAVRSMEKNLSQKETKAEVIQMQNRKKE